MEAIATPQPQRTTFSSDVWLTIRQMYPETYLKLGEIRRRQKRRHKKRKIGIPKVIIVNMNPQAVAALANPPAKLPKEKKGREKGSKGYSDKGTFHALDIIEKVLPSGTDLWGKVAAIHANKYRGRDYKSIRGKYNKLLAIKGPTGTPELPEEVIQARRIRYKIAAKYGVGSGEGEFDIGGGSPEQMDIPDDSLVLDSPEDEYGSIASTDDEDNDDDDEVPDCGKTATTGRTSKSPKTTPTLTTPPKRDYSHHQRLGERMMESVELMVANQAENAKRQAEGSKKSDLMIATALSKVADATTALATPRGRKANEVDE